ncbi:MAG: ParA family protein [Gammaproteobacteria bacterium]|nr:ParA family protein [Gammaproteobacteria bacterium]
MQRIIILNPKGGSGKTTVATNLAARYANSGQRPALMDLDPQGSSTRWLKKRKQEYAAIHGIAAFERSAAVTRSWQLRIPPNCGKVVVDTPAALDAQRIPEVTRGADAILVPVMPSEIDIHAAAKCIADLLLVGKIRRSEGRLGIIANRVRSNTLIFQSLMRFLKSLEIPLVATFRDTQNYIRAAQSGIGIDEMPKWQAGRDIEDWDALMTWLDNREPQTRAAHSNPDMPATIARIGTSESLA